MQADLADAKAVFLVALEKTSPDERRIYLDQACQRDLALRDRVEALLIAHDSGSFPDFVADAAPAFDVTQSVEPTPNEVTETSAGHAGPASADFSFLLPPREAGHLGRLDHYEVHSVIGQGGMGVVMKALDTSLDRIVAIKVLGSQYGTNGTARKRFIREAKAVAAVTHEHVVAVHAVDERVPYIVMQYVQGISLQDRIDRSGPLELKEILRIGTQIAAGLAAAHKQGLVHRDIKPSNILLENGVERVKITDFGLARAVDDASVTQSGVIAGTPMYMSPEQARGEVVDPRSDLFSLGSVMYSMCTGHAPFRASGTMAVMKRVIEDSPRSIQEVNAEIPDWLEAIVFKLLAKKPEDRFQSAKEVAELLEQCLAHVQQPEVKPLPAPPPTILRPRVASTAYYQKSIFAAMILGLGGLILVLLGHLTKKIYGLMPGEADTSTGSVMTIAGVGSVGVCILLFTVAGICFLVGRAAQRRQSLAGPALPVSSRLPKRRWPRVVGWAVLVLLIFVAIATWGNAAGKIKRLFYHEVVLEPEGGAATIQIWETDDQVEHPNAQSVKGKWNFTQGGMEPVVTTLLTSTKRFRLAPGNYWVSARQGDVQVLRKLISVGWGGETLLRIPANAEKPDLGWMPLFNGKDLSGWKKHPDEEGAGDWTVQGGILMGSGARSHLFTDRGDFTNFHFRAETRINKRGQSGVLFRADDGVRLTWRPFGYEALIIDSDERNTPKTGSLHDLQPVRENLVKPDEWFTLEIIALGRTLTIKVNGHLTVQYFDPTEPDVHPFGHFALQVWEPETIVQFRKIEIKELPTTPLSDEDRLQGTWRAVSAEFAGKPSSPVEQKLVIANFAGDRIRVTFPPKGLIGTGSFTLNPTSIPRQITVKATSENNQAMEGIYRFDGERLVLCMGGGSDPRPTEFATKAGSSYVLVTLERGSSVKNTPFELTPPKLLEHMVGSWSVEITQKLDPAQPVPTKHVGRMLIEPVAGGRFIIMRTLTDNGGPDDLQPTGFDRENWEFRGMYFDSKGTVRGPNVGRFDAATRTLTSVSQPEDGLVRVRNTRFPDADTIVWDVVWRARDGKTLVDRQARMKRLPTAGPPLAEVAATDLPKEMGLLDRYVGTWDVDMMSRVRPGEKWRTEMTGRKILGGRFVEVRERVLPSGEENYALYTFDPQMKRYRQWYFSSRWMQSEGSGTWKEDTKTMTWKSESANELATTSWTFASADKTEFRVTVNDRTGKTLEDIEGSHTRRPPPK